MCDACSAKRTSANVAARITFVGSQYELPALAAHLGSLTGLDLKS
jgi:hypothetical protein